MKLAAIASSCAMNSRALRISAAPPSPIMKALNPIWSTVAAAAGM
jgi:hypothetical protein